MTRNLFVYGLLQHPEVLKPLIGFVPEMSSAKVYDYARRTLVHEDFEPCALAVLEAGREINGVVLHDLSPQSVAYLDAFECVDRGIYTRESVLALCDGQRLACEMYVRGPALDASNVGSHWDQNAFNLDRMDYVLKELVPSFANF